jgi:hypothetical protein
MSKTSPRPRALFILLATLLLIACGDPGQQTAGPQSSEPEAESWTAFVDRQIEEHLAAHPAWAVTQGRHEYDGQLPDWSRAGIEAEARRLHRARTQALAFADTQLDGAQRYQREYMVSRLDHDLFWLEKARWPFRNPRYYLSWLSDSLDPSAYITLDYAPPEIRMQAFTRYLENLPVALAQIKDNLAGPLPGPWLQLGADSFGGYADYFAREVPGVWAGVGDEALQAAFSEANENAITAMRSLADWFAANLPMATDDYALGAELYREMLWDTERVDISLAELEAIGRADMARNIARLEAACDEFAPGEGVRDCFAKMAANKPSDGSVALARDQLHELRAFIERENLVGIPGADEAGVDESPPYARSNFAYINIPGPWEKNQPSVYYISPPNPAWPEDVQAAYIAGEADQLFTSVHEVWPGHFLNFLHAKQATFFYGRVFVGYAYAEGWAHYTEEMMLDAGLRSGDAEAVIGQISNALLRNARFIASIGLHTQGWSVQDAERFFVEEAFQSRGTAIQQAARGTYDPAYLNYTMGKLLIARLRDDWTAGRGGKGAWRDFHDAFLSYGGPPIPLVRQQMMGESKPTALFPGQ